MGASLSAHIDCSRGFLVDRRLTDEILQPFCLDTGFTLSGTR